MPRQSRIELPGSLHHVMARGIDRQKIFYDERDLFHFRDRFGDLISQSGNRCFAWALLTNHFHLLLKSGNEPLSRMMRRLLTGYAVYFNQRHKRSGHLFQNRFKSILCQEDTYFLQLVRYIHLNPIRAGEIETLQELAKYPFTGHAYIVGNLENEWQDTQYSLQWFGSDKQTSQARYIEFIKDGLSEGKREDLTGGGLLRTAGGWKNLQDLKMRGESMLGDERMLGDSDFVEEVWKNTHGKNNQAKISDGKQYSLDQLVINASIHFKVEPSDVCSASKNYQIQKAKSVICYLAVRILHYSGSEVANHLNISRSSVSRMVSGFQQNESFQQFLRSLHLAE
ncbi:MAG: transposase [Deltaproteobacteria bacterium]|nr:transposase [Deltaproteobacteria bacterium]